MNVEATALGWGRRFQRTSDAIGIDLARPVDGVERPRLTDRGRPPGKPLRQIRTSRIGKSAANVPLEPGRRGRQGSGCGERDQFHDRRRDGVTGECDIRRPGLAATMEGLDEAVPNELQAKLDVFPFEVQP